AFVQRMHMTQTSLVEPVRLLALVGTSIRKAHLVRSVIVWIEQSVVRRWGVVRLVNLIGVEEQKKRPALARAQPWLGAIHRRLQRVGFAGSALLYVAVETLIEVPVA